jgi:uncharacterized repeat protein (TIGR03803 family)
MKTITRHLGLYLTSRGLATRLKLFLLLALIAGLDLIPASRVTAQTFTNLHNFTGGSGGLSPGCVLVLSGNTLYGTTEGGGSGGSGTVFSVNTNGTGFTVLHGFTANPLPIGTNSDGDGPQGTLVLSGNTLYGTAYFGGSSGNGTVFAVHTDGTGFTTLHSFTAVGTNSSGYGTNSDGLNPTAGLMLSGTTLYGTAPYGGISAGGTVFALQTDGTGFTTLHNFTGASDGNLPYAGLILSGTTLYGTAHFGGIGIGTVFAVNTNGTRFTTLHSFGSTSGDGALPDGGVIVSGNTLYGTTSLGGSLGTNGNGTVFAVHTDGTGFTTLHSFTAASTDSSGYHTNSDGTGPEAGLVLSGTTLYGTAYDGGTNGLGTVFAVNTDGTGFTTLHDFTDGDGADPVASLILSGTTLYGTTSIGGA